MKVRSGDGSQGTERDAICDERRIAVGPVREDPHVIEAKATLLVVEDTEDPVVTGLRGVVHN